MTFTVNTVTRCSGQQHWTVVVTIAGVQHTIHTTPQEMTFNPLGNEGDTRDRILERMRSAAKEGGANTFTQAKAFLEGKSYQI